MYPSLKPVKRPPPTTPRTPAPTRPKFANDNSVTESLQVFCRLRPTDDTSCVQKINDTTIKLTMPESSVNFRSGAREYQYSFKKIFTEIHNQKDVYNVVARPLVENLIKGRNGLLFTYGVTGSGKTFTMAGQENNVGILPRCLDVLFNTISDYQAKKYVFKPDKMNGFEVQSEADALREQEEILRSTYSKVAKLKKNQSNENLTDVRSKDDSKLSIFDEDNAYSVFVTYIEIYNNTVYDLLENIHDTDVFTKLQSKIIREDGAHNMYVHGVTEIEVKSADEAYEIFRKGQKRKRVEHTNLNKESSRSHSIFTIRLVQTPLDVDGENVLQDKKAMRISQLSLVDLAGSERTNRTKNCGQRLREAGNINNSLMTLRNCLEILRENQQTGSFKMIPHRESRLTHLFKNFFEGEGDIRMIVCVNPRVADYDETIQVMKFAEVSQEIQVKPTPAKMDVPFGLTPGRRQICQQKKQALKELRDRAPLALAYIPSDAEKIYSLEPFPSFENYDPFDPETNRKLYKFLEDRIQKKKSLMADFETRCEKFRTKLLTQEENYLKIQQDYDALNARRECDSMKADALEKKIVSLDDNSSNMKRRCELYEDEIKRLKRDLEQKALTIKQFSMEKDRHKRAQQKIAAKVDKLSKEKENSTKEKQQIELQLKEREKRLRRVKKALGPHEENTRVKIARYEDHEDIETISTSSAEVVYTYEEEPPLSSGVKSMTSPTKSIPVSNPRFGRTHCNANDEWLDHRTTISVPLNTVMQPVMKRRRSFSNVTSPKEITKTSKYCLTTQNQDENGTLETQLYKGDIRRTCKGGAQVVFNDVETLRQTSPVTSPIMSPVTSPRKSSHKSSAVTSPSKSYHDKMNSAIAAKSGSALYPDISERCAVSVEGRSLRKR